MHLKDELSACSLETVAVQGSITVASHSTAVLGSKAGTFGTETANRVAVSRQPLSLNWTALLSGDGQGTRTDSIVGSRKSGNPLES